MSVINKALSQLVAKQPNGLAGIERAKVAPVAARPAWVWALAGFAVSVAVGGWAVSWQATSLDASNGQHSLSVTANQAGQISPQAVVGSCSSIFAAVDNDASRVEAPSGVTLSLSTPNGYLDFDSLGRAAQCSASPCTVTISSTHDQRQVCINTEGYIYAC
ncbi:hypothetical protein [Vibrio metschnikovii]|uniref:hypothetical protein n=1 Tax=Vibrio metschnikovii TaxID=28172 RepID=UPI002FCB9B0E